MAACAGLFAYFRRRARKALQQEEVLHENTKECCRVLGREHDDQAALLKSVFPAYIAEQLKEGKKVEPRKHESVTVMFSDIVGYTNIARKQDPVKVMQMLDRLYEAFDTVACSLGVFKVETIGDAYMAVTNLDGNQPFHAKVMAKFAANIIAKAQETPIDLERPELGMVNIRVGLHTGPVVSSVVGKLLPHFTLFGDTVNTASRMESSSATNRIHVSASTASHLRSQVASMDMILEERGIIPVKGKGEMQTFWLVELEQRRVSQSCRPATLNEATYSGAGGDCLQQRSASYEPSVSSSRANVNIFFEDISESQSKLCLDCSDSALRPTDRRRRSTAYEGCIRPEKSKSVAYNHDIHDVPMSPMECRDDVTFMLLAHKSILKRTESGEFSQHSPNYYRTRSRSRDGESTVTV